MSKTRFSISSEQLEENFFESSRLIGMMAPVRDYQLCWQVNRALGLNFRVNNDLEICLERKHKNFYFTVFEYTEPVTSVSHYLYNNHCRAEFLLPELKNIDFLWLLKGDYYQAEDVKRLMEQLRQVESIQLVTPVNHAELKNKQHLIF